jgi:protein phosphatase
MTGDREELRPAGDEHVVDVPELSLVVLIGISGAGKSTFASRHFARTEVISSDFCRGLVADDENDQSASKDAFDVLHFIAGKRLAADQPGQGARRAAGGDRA